MRIFIILMAFLIIAACNKQEEISLDGSLKLSFSTDSLLFDTVFTSVGSITKTLKVYNPNKNALSISEIALTGGNGSAFKININGSAVSQIQNIKINGRDSLYIFVKVNINPNLNTNPFIVEDQISFITNGNKQEVNIAAYGQNAIFLNNKTLKENTTFTKDLPYIIYNAVLVDAGKTLTINPGARVYFHKKSKLFVAGSLKVNGTFKDSVIFTSDRLEKIYSDEPAQWDGIHLLRNSFNNTINYTVVKNATIGIRVDSLSENNNPKLILSNSIVKNHEVAGLAGFTADVLAVNNLFYNCGSYLFLGSFGGNYRLYQNTFAAYNFNFSRNTPALLFTDYLNGNNKINTLKGDINNNIIWGSLMDELIIDTKNPTSDLKFSLNLIKSSKTALINNFYNTDPEFIDARNGNFKVKPTSVIINKGKQPDDPFVNNILQTDLLNKTRIFPSELGCYELN